MHASCKGLQHLGEIPQAKTHHAKRRGADMTVVFDAHGSLDTPAQTLSGYEPALVTAATISLLGAVAALGISRQRRTATVGGPAPVEELAQGVAV